MERSDYINVARNLGVHRSMGQNFLLNSEIAAMESNYGKGMTVIELGPGLGILTRELCRSAKKVIAVEKDERLFGMLGSELKSKKLRLIMGDFFEIDSSEFDGAQIMISNIPYELSSKVIYWLGSREIPALLCIQKEFSAHMLARPGSRDYSKLSVVSSLKFNVHNIREVPAGNFYPRPRVDSRIVYLVPKKVVLDPSIIRVISLIMNHKKKRLRNAVVDSADGLGIGKVQARKLAQTLDHSDERPFQLEPSAILEIAERIRKELALE
ncbi:MAG: 16S rRNA (adenine(1518)-N(6)/adenine(1519)-N(6))-dimethyltransferase RsmA [Candidatus Micrarchaeaceae archaeon]|jgi:16S rRNA (adenine1518-N6/adenine1519-N6)-dimethyltransferase